MSLSNNNWSHYFKENPETTWFKFLDSYNKLIMSVISKYVNDYDEKMEIYAFTLQHLNKDQYKNLTGFYNKTRNYPFETWIAVLIRNCCMDWFRQEKGRKRLLKCIKDLPEIQIIFRHRVEIFCFLKVSFRILNRN